MIGSLNKITHLSIYRNYTIVSISTKLTNRKYNQLTKNKQLS